MINKELELELIFAQRF